MLNYPEGGAEWDPEHGEAVGLQEEDGVFWLPDTRNYGVIEPGGCARASGIYARRWILDGDR